MHFFYMNRYICFFKQEKPEMDDLKERKKFGSKGKILGKISIFQENIFEKF